MDSCGALREPSPWRGAGDQCSVRAWGRASSQETPIPAGSSHVLLRIAARCSSGSGSQPWKTRGGLTKARAQSHGRWGFPQLPSVLCLSGVPSTGTASPGGAAALPGPRGRFSVPRRARGVPGQGRGCARTPGARPAPRSCCCQPSPSALLFLGTSDRFEGSCEVFTFIAAIHYFESKY